MQFYIKIRWSWLIATATFLHIFLTGAQSAERQILNINRSWQFQLGDVSGAEKNSFDDSGWNRINLPHNFSMPYFQTPHWYTGYGWYRKHLQVPAAWSSQRVFLEFEGAFRVAEVFVNGVKAGIHKGGYTGFSIDITSCIRTGDNVLAVRLNNLFDPALAPRNGDHNFTGGIYRDVRLVVTNPVHITWYGTCATTPGLANGDASVHMQTEVVNQGRFSKNYTLVTQILDPDGKKVAEVTTSRVLFPLDTFEFTQITRPVPSVKYWHPAHPSLYKAVSVLMDGKKVLDRYSTTFGFRWFKFTADKGFFLNGSHYYFKGANVHQDQAGWASAVTNAAIVRDVKLIRDCGMDFIRGSHYPHDPAFSDACDSLGILLWEENDFWGSGGNQRENNNWFEGCGAYPAHPEDRSGFEASVRSDLREMIRIHRNHPSVIVWSMCNEPFFTDGKTLPNVRAFLKELVQLTHQLDPTRPAGIGGCQRGGIDTLGDVAGYNGDGARLFINPGIPSVVTEYGSTIARRPGKFIPGWGDLQQEKFPWRSGEALWCAFDYGTRAGDFGLMGMVDYFRTPKNMWYWYRKANLGIEPPVACPEGQPDAVCLNADKNTIASTDGTDDVRIEATIVDASGTALSVSPDVTLQIVSGPGEFPTGRSIVFSATSDCYIRDGKAAITFRSYEGGTTLIRAFSPGLKADTLVIRTLGSPLFEADKTPLVTERPYTRYVWIKPTNPESQPVNLVSLKPTRASSEMPEQTADKATDNDMTSCWQSVSGLTAPWWQSDLENLYKISSLQVRLNPENRVPFRVLGSTDAQTWFVLYQSADVPDTVVKINSSAAEIVRFVRISFATPSGKSAALRDVVILGTTAASSRIQ